MDQSTEEIVLKALIHKTIHDTDLTIKTIAKKLGCGPSFLYRIANPTDPGAELRAEWIVPLCEMTQDFSLIRHLAFRLNFMCVRLPGSREMKHMEVATHQALLAKYVNGLHQYMSGDIEQEKCLALVEEALIELADVREMVRAGTVKETREPKNQGAEPTYTGEQLIGMVKSLQKSHQEGAGANPFEGGEK